MPELTPVDPAAEVVRRRRLRLAAVWGAAMVYVVWVAFVVALTIADRVPSNA